MNLIKKNKNNKGFSLLELILAVAIFSLGSYAMATLLIDVNINTRYNTEKTEALFYAKEGLSATQSIRDKGWADFTTTEGSGLVVDSGGWILNGDASDLIDNKYTRTVSIEEVDTWLKKITSTISWPLTPTRTSSITLTTYLSDWKENITDGGVSTPYAFAINGYDSLIYRISTETKEIVGDPIYAPYLPVSLAVDSEGNVISVGQDGNWILKSNGADGTEIWSNYDCPQDYNEWQGYEYFQHVTIDANDDILVNTNFNNICKISSDGTYIGIYLVYGATKGMAVDSENNIYITGNDWGGAMKISLGDDGEVTNLWGTSFPDNKGDDYYGTDVALDANGKVWVTSDEGYIYAFDAANGDVLVDRAGDGGNYKAVTVDASGNVWVSNWGNVTRFDNDGTYVDTYSCWGDSSGIDADAEGNIWVINGDGAGIAEFSYPDYELNYYPSGGYDPEGPYIQFGDFTGFTLQYYTLGLR